MSNITRSGWSNVKQGLKTLNIDFMVEDTCCVGCMTYTGHEGEPSLYTLARMFKPLTGGFLYHQNIANNSELAQQLVELFEGNGYEVDWNLSESHFIHVL